MKVVVEKRLEGIPQSELKKAKEKLDVICNEYGIKTWDLNSGKADWRELCFIYLQ